MNLLLICETAIIEHIFSLVCKKLNLELKVQKNNNIDKRFDLIIVDQNFIDDKFNIIKQFSKKLGAISSEELSFDKSRDFLIPRPFLPTTLISLLQEQIELIKNEERKESEQKIDSSSQKEEFEEDEEVTIPVTDYVESLADEIYEDIKEESDESIVNLAATNIGGVLDSNELSKINNILKEESIQDEINYEKEDWKNISDIIDDALQEVKEYEFNLEENEEVKPYNLMLSNYQIDELKPLLEKLNQSLIDKLSNGETIDIKIALKEKN